MKSNISVYHMDHGLYHVRHSMVPQPKTCRLGFRDKRPIPNLVFPVDAQIRAAERQRRLEAKKAELEEKKRAAQARRWHEEEAVEF